MPRAKDVAVRSVTRRFFLPLSKVLFLKTLQVYISSFQPHTCFGANLVGVTSGVE